ncbi:hypothetical protein ACJX0J_023121, partial [Zea mays]
RLSPRGFNPDWVGWTATQLGVNWDCYSAAACLSCSWIGEANRLVCCSLLGRIMKLKNSAVETFKENNMIFTSEGNLHSKKMREDYVASPNQPGVVQTRCKWIIGDVTEVFDRSTWKLGKILKMLKNNYFVIRLADCIQLKEFHISSLRIPRGLEAPQSKPFHAADK